MIGTHSVLQGTVLASTDMADLRVLCPSHKDSAVIASTLSWRSASFVGWRKTIRLRQQQDLT